MISLAGTAGRDVCSLWLWANTQYSKKNNTTGYVTVHFTCCITLHVIKGKARTGHLPELATV